MQNQEFLKSEKVGKLMLGYAVPCIISLLVGALYNVVDQIFIANAAYLGSYGNAANTVVFPLTVIALGICSFLAQISLVAAMAATNNMIRKYGATDAVFGQPEFAQIPMAVFGIVMKFFQIAISVSIGLAAGCIPVVGYNVGAKEYKRVKTLLGELVLCEVALGVVSLLIVELMPRALIGIFGAANESEHYTLFSVRCFRIYLSTIVLAFVNKAAFIFLQSMGKAVLSTLLSLVREVALGVSLVIILPLFFGLDGVLYSMPAADSVTFIISAAVLIYTYKKLDKLERENAVSKPTAS